MTIEEIQTELRDLDGQSAYGGGGARHDRLL